MTYCWWTKSCTTKDNDYPITCRVLTIPGGAGFLPSTVCYLLFNVFLLCFCLCFAEFPMPSWASKDLRIQPWRWYTGKIGCWRSKVTSLVQTFYSEVGQLSSNGYGYAYWFQEDGGLGWKRKIPVWNGVFSAATLVLLWGRVDIFLFPLYPSVC